MSGCLVQGRGKAAGGSQVTYQLTLKWEMILNYPDGPNVITRALIRGRERQEGEPEKWCVKGSP